MVNRTSRPSSFEAQLDGRASVMRHNLTLSESALRLCVTISCCRNPRFGVIFPAVNSESLSAVKFRLIATSLTSSLPHFV